MTNNNCAQYMALQEVPKNIGLRNIQDLPTKPASPRPVDRTNIDRANFDASLYVKGLLTRQSVQELISTENKLKNEVFYTARSMAPSHPVSPCTFVVHRSKLCDPSFKRRGEDEKAR